jgi:hypothetical protein
MALGVLWAAFIGAGLGLDRSLRKLRAGVVACAVSAAASALVAIDLRLAGVAESIWFWPFAAAACAVALGYYLATTTAPGGWRRAGEPLAAVLAACALGATLGLGANRFAGLMIFVTIFALAWRPLVAEPLDMIAAPAPSGAPIDLVHVGRRAEESRNDDERGHQGEEQRQGEQLAHAGGARMAG